MNKFAIIVICLTIFAGWQDSMRVTSCKEYGIVQEANCATFQNAKYRYVKCRTRLENGEVINLMSDVTLKGDIIYQCDTHFDNWLSKKYLYSTFKRK